MTFVTVKTSLTTDVMHLLLIAGIPGPQGV